MRWSEVGFRPQRPMVGHGAHSGDSPASPAAPVRHISGQEKTRNCQYGSRPEVKNINKVKQQSRKFCCLGEVGKELRGKRLPIQCRTSDPLGFGFAWNCQKFRWWGEEKWQASVYEDIHRSDLGQLNELGDNDRIMLALGLCWQAVSI